MAKVGGTENSPKGKAAKIALRRRALDWIGAGNANVFEGYAGNGAMWRAVWREAAHSVGVDRRTIWDASRVLYIAEVDRLMRAIDLQPFNVFDLDAFGSPWPTAFVMAERRKLAPGERVAVILTDGSRFDLDAFGSPWPTAFVMAERRKLAPGERVAVILTDGSRRAAMTGKVEGIMSILAGTDPRATGAHGEGTWAALTRGAVAGMAKRMGARVVWEQVDGGHGANGSMTYSAFGLEGRKAAEAPVGAGTGADR